MLELSGSPRARGRVDKADVCARPAAAGKNIVIIVNEYSPGHSKKNHPRVNFNWKITIYALLTRNAFWNICALLTRNAILLYNVILFFLLFQW